MAFLQLRHGLLRLLVVGERGADRTSLALAGPCIVCPPLRRLEAAPLRKRNKVARAVQHPHDDDFVFAGPIIYHMAAGKSRAKTGSQETARGARERKVDQIRHRRFDAGKQPRRDPLGAFSGHKGPDFGEVASAVSVRRKRFGRLIMASAK